MKVVVGFLFDEIGYALLLLKRPGDKVYSGKWNGIGGKVKIGETPNAAMRREALEEANVVLPDGVRWEPFHYERHPPSADNTGGEGECTEIYFFTAKVHRSHVNVQAMTDEVVGWMNTKTIFRGIEGPCRYVPNLEYLIPMAEHWLRYPGAHYLEG